LRSAILVIATLVLLVGAFFVYRTAQTPVGMTAERPRAIEVAAAPTTQQNRMSIGPGENVWVVQHDSDTGRMANRFRGARYDWNPDGSMKVERPQAEFFLDEGRILRVSGERGNVVVEQGAGGQQGASAQAKKASPLKRQAEAPSRGDLQDVTIGLYESETSARPTLTVSMPNATFDTQTNRIFTEATEIDGKRVERDQVPVTVRGADYDFDGRGLTIRWDQVQRKLQLLEVAHGERLTIKNPQHAMRQGTPNALQPATAQAPAGAIAAAPQTPAPPAKASSPAVPHAVKRPQVYRASFYDRVRVVQGKADLVNAAEMQIDFAADEQNAPTKGGGAQPTQPAAPAVAANTAPAPATAAVAGTAGQKPADTSGVELSNEPIVIYWAGKLTVSPAEGTTEMTADERGQVVRMLGQPVVVRQKDTEIRGAALVYGTAEERLIGRGGPGAPMVMKNADGGVVETDAIEYLRRRGTARLTGRGQVTRPFKAEGGRPAGEMRTSWTKSCELLFGGADAESMAIQTANLEGDVHVQHPQLKVDSQKLQLAFAPEPTAAGKRRPSTAPGGTDVTLKEVHAQGAVKAEVKDQAGKSQALECQQMDLTAGRTADGQFFAERLVAEGNVRAYDADQDLRAGRLVADMAPLDPAAAKQAPAANAGAGGEMTGIQLKRMVAERGVRLKGRDATSAEADMLEVAMDGQQPKLVRLTGQPARVIKAQNTTVGGVIELNPQTQEYEIKGPGAMHLVREDGNTSPPVEVTWQGGVQARLQQNVIDVARDVVVKSAGADQTLSTATSQNLRVVLVEKQMSAEAAAAAAQRKNDRGLLNDNTQVDIMKQKEPHLLKLSGDTLLQAVCGDDAGALVMQFDLRADAVDYNIPAQKMLVPVPGQIFFYDDRKVDPKAVAKPAGDKADPMAGDKRGTTAMKWDGELVYDQLGGRIALNRGIYMRHEPKDAGQAPMEMWADRVTVDLLKSGEKIATTKAANPAAAMPTDQINVRRLLAEENVRFAGRNLQFTASSAEYNPETGVFVARGTDRVPALLLDEQGASKGTFTEIRWNMRTQQIDGMTGFKANVRQTR
jgi:hypothetical protein